MIFKLVRRLLKYNGLLYYLVLPGLGAPLSQGHRSTDMMLILD